MSKRRRRLQAEKFATLIIDVYWPLLPTTVAVQAAAAATNLPAATGDVPIVALVSVPRHARAPATIGGSLSPANSPITTILRQICEAYPESSCLRELLQNADDAQASEIEYILDTTTYHEGPLLNEGLRAYHGPALLVKNNSVFADDDFASLASIGDDPASTGKYGQGFNSCFHWTDGPWILSRQWLLFLDPHREWSQGDGGPTYDFVECQDSLEMQNNLKPFKSATVDTSHAVDGTVIRIPLRTKAQAARSKIVNREISTEEITEALHELGQEIKAGGMLFLRHVRKVTAKINDTILWQAHATGATEEDTQAMQSISGAFRGMYTSLPEKGEPEELSRGFYVNVQYLTQSSPSTHSFFVQHKMTRLSTKSIQSRTPALNEWAQTGQPVHIHGLFAIVPDRSRLSSSGPDSEWNRFMFRECVSDAWTDLLFSRRFNAWKDEIFRLWPQINITESRELWSSLDEPILDRIITQNLAVWNTQEGCVSLQDGIFASDGEDVRIYGDVFNSIQLPLIRLASSMYAKVLIRAATLDKNVPTLSPHSLRQFLRENNQHQIPQACASLLLQYCLLDFTQSSATSSGIDTKIRHELRDIQLWPTMQNSLAALDDTMFFLPRGEEETLLFQASRRSHTLDLHCFTPPVIRLLQGCATRLSTFIRHRRISDLEIDWEHIYPLPSPSSQLDICPRDPKNDHIILNVWSWICARYKDEGESSIVSKPNLSKLFLVPVDGLRIRRFAFDGVRCVTLIAEDDSWIRGLLEHEPSGNEPGLDFVLDNRCLPAKAVKLLRLIARKRSDTAFAAPNDLQSLVTWLVANKDGLKEHSVQHKEMLIRELKLLTESTGASLERRAKTLLGQMISQLPIFKQVFAVAPYKERLHRLTAIDPSSSRAMQTVSSLPPVPEIPGLTLYRPSDSHEQHLVNSYNLLEKVSRDELIFEYLLPFFEEQEQEQDDAALAEVKLNLVNFALEHITRPSDSWKARFCRLALVPKASRSGFRSLADTIDPTSPLSDLFFEDEDVFPEPGFFERHRVMLVSCGIIREITPEILLERVRTFASSQKDIQYLNIRVQCTLNMSLPADFTTTLPPASLGEIRGLKWLPASSLSYDGFRLVSPEDCRASDEKELVDKVLCIVEANVKPEWKRLLGWDQDIGQSILTQQLKYSLTSGACDQINDILTYLKRFGDCQFLKPIPCFLSRHGEYLLPERSVLPGSLLSRYSLSPYLDEVEPSFANRHSTLLTALGIRGDICDEDILMVQDDLRTNTKSGPLSDNDLDVSVALLEIATCLGNTTGTRTLSEMLIPDTEKKLRPRVDIVYGDRNVAGKVASFNFVHPRLSPDLTQRLDIEKSIARAIRLEIDFNDEDEDEYTPREKLSTTISDTLGRYPIESTFSEFLANANDCGATQISWVLDDCAAGAYDSLTLLDEELRCLQGPALFGFNDGVFSEKDFEGFKDIGHGGKIDDVTSTGMFGRGAMTMYHFTDVPMLISGSSFLILDPQQQRLPRNKHGQHKAGMKIPLETARRLFPDQLRPFDGLHGYSITDESYGGTLYRLPLRLSDMTLLKETSAKVDVGQVKVLLEDYYSTARISLLFLRNITEISFGVRGLPISWSVQSERSSSSFEEIFERVTIQSKHEPDMGCKMIWRVGITDIEEAPDKLANPGRRANKITECGLAACVEVIGNLSSKEVPKQRVFCTLPTLSPSGLPVSIHASFAITGDRKTIPFESVEKESAMKSWNRWLLTKCIPEFYIDFLKDLAPKLGEASFKFWPWTTTTASIGSLGEVVREAFWTQLTMQQYETYQLYPLLDTHSSSDLLTRLKSRASGKVRKLFKVASLKSAQFDILSHETSRKLRPLFCKLCPSLVRPPHQLWQRMSRANIHRQATSLNADYISALFKDGPNCTILQNFVQSFTDDRCRDEVLEMLLHSAVPSTSSDDQPPIDIVNHCRIIPKLDQSLGTVRFRAKDSAPFPCSELLFLPTDKEAELFSDRADLLIKPSLFRGSASRLLTLTNTMDADMKTPRNPLHDMMTEYSNIREIGVADIHLFLAHVNSYLTPVNTSGPSHNWMVHFWAYLNPRLEAYLEGQGSELRSAPVGDLLRRLKLHDARIYRYLQGSEWRYITPEQFERGPYIIPPADEKQFELCKLLLGINILDPECIPLQLQHAESNLISPLAFGRLLRAFAANARGASLRIWKENPKRSSTDILRASIQAFARTDEVNDSRNRRILRQLPVWTQYKCHTDSSTNKRDLIPAEGAYVCPHGAMLQPWIPNCDRFIDPTVVSFYSKTLEALGCSIMTVQSTWSYLEPKLPTILKSNQLEDYLHCIERLASNGCRPTSKIAPNGWKILRSPSVLFDHEDAIFLAAFGESDNSRFLHPLFREEREFWRSIGLRSRSKAGFMDASDFLECVSRIVVRFSSSAEDAGKVTGYLRFFHTEFEDWPNEAWTTIAQAEMYCADSDVSSEPQYRRARMLSLADESTPLSIENAAYKAHKRVIWSQRPFLKDPPDSAVYTKLPYGGKPGIRLVYNHLKFLIGMRNDVWDADLPKYLQDLQATYAYLQEYRSETVSIPSIREAQVWLNLPTTDLASISSSQFDGALRSVKSLCFNAPIDTPKMERAKNFLIPYETLLRALGCQSVVRPPKPTIASRGNDVRPMDQILMAIREMRKQGQLSDVIFEAEGCQIPANRNFMAAASEFCKSHFLGEWGRLLGGGDEKATVEIDEVSAKTLGSVVDFAYTGEVRWPELRDSQDPSEVSDALDELLDLLRVADMWLMDTLHRLTEQHLLEMDEVFIRLDNVKDIRPIVEAANARYLVQHCDNYIRANPQILEDYEDEGE
ncbi:MAG: hypothetical protein Q9216_005988 [Gyalolechia sp. 2 TL-2023]